MLLARAIIGTQSTDLDKPNPGKKEPIVSPILPNANGLPLIKIIKSNRLD
jgi:hypothetical protein